MNLREKCPLCSSTSSENFMECKDFTVSNETFKIVTCQSCGLHYTQNPPSEENIGDYYKSEEYISHSSTQKGLINKLYQIVRNKALKKKVKLVQHYFQKEKTLLDIGAGTGHFVQECIQNNIRAVGLEPDEDARKNAKELHGLELKNLHALKDFSEIEVVTMWHVLEHVYHLRDFIQDLQSRIKKNGVWIVAVPNMSSHDAKHYQKFWAAYDVPRHLYHFQPKQMKFIADEFGFVLEKILPMKYDSYYVSMLSEKYKGGNIIKAAYRGFKSNIKANKESYSSQIYIFRKK